MKKFKIIRNVLIIIILLISAIYIFWIRENKVESSKSVLLYKNMFETSYKKEDSITMKIKYSNDRMNMTIVQATDNTEEKEVTAIKHNDFNEINNHPDPEDMEDIITCTVSTKDGLKGYKLIPKRKKYEIIYNNDERMDSYNNWISDNLSRISNCKYFTRGYEVVNGKLLYTENFKEIGLKMYFDEDRLVYMRSDNLDEAFNDLDDALYEVEITYDDSYKEFTDIPEDYIEKEA